MIHRHLGRTGRPLPFLLTVTARRAQVLGVSESRVCQRHAEIVDQLKARFSRTPCDMVA